MKKCLLSLMMVLMLSVNACALAEQPLSFPFTAQEIAAAYETQNEGAKATLVEGGYVLESEGRSPIVAGVDGNGMCVALNSSVSIPLGGGSAGDGGVELGMSAFQMMYLTRLLELGEESEQLTLEMSEMSSAFQALMSSFTDADYENFITAPVVKQQVICGHNASITLSFDMLQMAIVMSFSYLP